MKRAPCSEVTPSEVCRTNEYLFCLFHNGIVNRDIVTFCITLGNDFFLFWSAKDTIVKHLLKDAGNAWLIHPEGINNGADIPHKDTSIPEIVVMLDILLCSLQIWLLAETLHTENFLITHTLSREISLNISISCFRTCWLHTKSNNSIRLCSKLQ